MPGWQVAQSFAAAREADEVTKHRDTMIRKPQWWKHLRDWKRVFWKRERTSGKQLAQSQGRGQGYG